MDLISEFNKVAFFEKLEPCFANRGYYFVPLLNQFRCNTESGFTNIIITPTLYSDVIYFEITFGSRINLVERTIQPYIRGLKGYKEDRNTAITSYGKYHGNPHVRLKAQSVNQLNAVIDEIQQFFEDEGFQYLQTLEKTVGLDTLFNTNPQKTSAVAFNHELRGFRGITLATLQQNPQWEKINSAYLKMFEQRHTPSILVDNYKRLVAFLSNSGLN